MKRCSISYVLRELQVKATMRCRHISIRMAQIWNTDTTECWWGCGATGTLAHCWWECKTVQPLWKTVWQFLAKLNILLPWYSNCTPWYLPKCVGTLHPHKNLHLHVYSSSFIHNCQNLDATEMSVSGQMDKMWPIQTKECYSVLKSELSSHEKIWDKLKCICLSERSQSEKPTHCVIPTIWHSGKG